LERNTLGMGGMKRIYDDLPILWIDDSWEEVTSTEDFLQKQWIELSAKLEKYDFRKLSKYYWLTFIKDMIPTDIE